MAEVIKKDNGIQIFISKKEAAKLNKDFQKIFSKIDADGCHGCYSLNRISELVPTIEILYSKMFIR